MNRALLVAALAIFGYMVVVDQRADATAPGSAVPVAAGKAACPTVGPVTSGWGRRWGRLHDGVDIGAPIGTPVRAVAAGTVTHSADDDPGGYGSYVEVTGPAGRQQYGHVSKRLARAGQHVRAGQVIARVGSEGQSTGPHLHLRIYPPGAAVGVDPVPWLRARGVRLPCSGGGQRG